MEHLNSVLRLLDKNGYDQWMSLTELNHRTQMRRNFSKFDFCPFLGKMPFNPFGKKEKSVFSICGDEEKTKWWESLESRSVIKFK